MPNSVLFPFQDYYEASGNFARQETYLARLPRRVGKALSGADLVAYCEVGVRAATMALLHELYTNQIIRVYDGSIMEWSHHNNLPMAEPTRV